MKIVFLVLGFFDELEYQENLLLKYYEKLGHEVHVITSTNTSLFHFVKGQRDIRAPERTYRLRTATIHRLRYTLNLLNRLQRFPDITPILEDTKPDLIFVHNVMLNMTECARYVRHHPGCKMILDFHGDYSNSGSSLISRKILHGLIFKNVLDRARPSLSRIFPITPKSEEFLRKVYRVPQHEMELLPLGADMDILREMRTTDTRSALRETYKISPDTIVVITGGKLTPLKKTEALIKAVKNLSHHKIFLIIIGEAPPEYGSYKRMLLDISEGHDNIRFVGWLPSGDIYRHFLMADIAAFPASQSILWQQAIGAGLPLIVGEKSTAMQDVSYLNIHGNILVVDKTESLETGILNCLRSLVESQPIRKRMAEGASATADELLDWNVLVRRTLRFVDGDDVEMARNAESFPPR